MLVAVFWFQTREPRCIDGLWYPAPPPDEEEGWSIDLP